MIPDEVHSRPIYRKLIERGAEELAEIDRAKVKSMKVKNPRKSRSVNISKRKSLEAEVPVTYSEGGSLQNDEPTEQEIDEINQALLADQPELRDSDMDNEMDRLLGIMNCVKDTANETSHGSKKRERPLPNSLPTKHLHSDAESMHLSESDLF